MAESTDRLSTRLAKKAQALDPLKAYVVSGALSTAVVAALFLALILVLAAMRGDLAEAATLDNLERGIVVWFFIAMVGYAVAAPFVILATWIGRRLQIESLAYYTLAGGLSSAALVYSVLGWPHRLGPQEFGFMTMFWYIGPPCGGAWGTGWWYVHRRWRAAVDQAPR